jgi:hypothetical protein
LESQRTVNAARRRGLVSQAGFGRRGWVYRWKDKNRMKMHQYMKKLVPRITEPYDIEIKRKGKGGEVPRGGGGGEIRYLSSDNPHSKTADHKLSDQHNPLNSLFPRTINIR